MKKIQKNKKINFSGCWRFGCDHCSFETDSQWELFLHITQKHVFRHASNIMQYD